MTRQDPLPTMGGPVRFERRGRPRPGATPPLAVEPGRLPFAWQTIIDPGSVILHVQRPGEPVAWERGWPTKAKVDEAGVLHQGHVFTPQATRRAETEWAWVMRAHRIRGPVEGPVGFLISFWTSGRRKADWDNLGKVISDAANGVLYVDDRQVEHVTITVHRGTPTTATDLLVWELPDR